MSAPGAEHEARVAVLDACAVLTGHLGPCPLAAAELPDVVRADHRHRRLFVGEAKDTETPGCAATRRRLHAYARALRPWLDGGFTVRLALCHGRTLDDHGWSALLEHAALCAGLAAGPAASDDLDGATVLTWLDVRPDADCRGPVPGGVLDDVGGGH